MSAHAKIFLLIFLSLALTTNSHALRLYKPEKYEAARARAVEVARQGDHQAALKSLERLIKLEPDNPGARYDYITVLVWDRQYAAAVEQYRQIIPARAPEYVLRSLVIATERAGQPDINSQLVTTYMQRFSRIPEDTPANISGKSYRELVNDEAQKGMPITSLNILKNLLKKNPQNQDVLGDYIVALSRNGQHTEAIKLQAQLDLANAPQYVISALLYSSYELGQTENQNKLQAFYGNPGKSQATITTVKKTQKATVPEISTTQPLDLMAQQLHWTQLYSSDPEQSLKDLDQLVSRYADFENTAVMSTPEIYRQWLSDYIVALQFQGNYGEIILVYENRKLTEIQPADYALQNVAGAYLQIRQPDTAIKVYSSLLERQPDNQALHSGLFYAYSDSHDYEAAFEIANAQVAKIGQWRKDHSGAVVKPNEDRLAAEIMLVNAYAYQDDLQQARAKLHSIIELAPYNAELHENLSTLYRWSEWPQQAMREANIANTINPDSISGRIAQTYALIDLYEYEAVEKQLDYFERPYFKDNAAVGRLKQHWQQHQKRELYSRLELGRTDVSENQAVQNPYGSADQSLETYIYDKPYSLYMRPYVHQYFAQADFEEGTDRYERLGAGMHWRKHRHDIRLGLNGSYNESSDIGISLSGDYALDDYWSVAYGFNSFSTNVPLRAYYQDISGSDYSLRLRYQKDPLQAVTAGISYLDFSDGNERQSGWISYEWRSINRPTYKMTLVPSVYASNNSQTGGPYFSPEDDLSISLGLRNVWTTRQNYDAFLKPHFDLEVGLYDQSGHDTKTNLSANYWHEQSFDRDLSMEYGVRFSRNYYDGQPENHSALFAVLNWRF